MLTKNQQREANLILALAGMYELRSNMTNSEFVAAKNSQITALLNIIGGKSETQKPTPALGNGEITLFQTTELLGKTLCVYGNAENPLFLAKDVAEWIEIKQPSVMIANVDDDEKVMNIIHTPGGKQNCWFLTENGLYEVLMLSRKPIAKEFKKGVKKILKEIRQKGYYANKTADNEIEVLCHSKIFEKILQAYMAEKSLSDFYKKQSDIYEKIAQDNSSLFTKSLSTIKKMQEENIKLKDAIAAPKQTTLKLMPPNVAKVQPEKIKMLIKVNWKGERLAIFGTEQRPLFCAKDIMPWFGLKSSCNTIKYVSDKNKEIHSNPCGTTGTRSWFITAEGVKELYRHYHDCKGYEMNVQETEFDSLIKTIKK